MSDKKCHSNVGQGPQELAWEWTACCAGHAGGGASGHGPRVAWEPSTLALFCTQRNEGGHCRIFQHQCGNPQFHGSGARHALAIPSKMRTLTRAPLPPAHSPGAWPAAGDDDPHGGPLTQMRTVAHAPLPLTHSLTTGCVPGRLQAMLMHMAAASGAPYASKNWRTRSGWRSSKMRTSTSRGLELWDIIAL